MSLCVCLYSRGFHNRCSCLAHWTASVPLWLYFRTLSCSKGQIKKHRNPHKAEGGGVGWRGLRAVIHQVTHTHLKHRAPLTVVEERQRVRLSERLKACGFISARTLYREDKKDLSVYIGLTSARFEFCSGENNRHLWASWMENQPTRRRQRWPVRPTATTTRFGFFCPAIIHLCSKCTSIWPQTQ